MRFSFFLMFLICNMSFSQKSILSDAIEIDFLRGNILPHSPDLYHLVKGHPDGFLLSFTNRTYGKKAWHKLYNFPNYGYFFIYQDFKNVVLGKNYGAGVFYDFYFLNKNLSIKIAQGVAFNTNPHDNENNNKNTAFGSAFLLNTNLGFTYKKENVYKNIGFQTGLMLTHYSNARFKSPNSGINTYNFTIGLNYNCNDSKEKIDTLASLSMKFTEPIRYNFVFRSGFNENPTIGSGQKIFYHLGFYADKRINRKSALQLGTDLFLTQSRKEYIRYRAISYPEIPVDINTDYKRIGIFIGHELFINKISIETQVGYYVYDPFKFDLPIYDRIGAKYYINQKLYAGLAIKTHGFLAEAAEFSIGYRL